MTENALIKKVERSVVIGIIVNTSVFCIREQENSRHLFVLFWTSFKSYSKSAMARKNVLILLYEVCKNT